MKPRAKRRASMRCEQSNRQHNSLQHKHIHLLPKIPTSPSPSLSRLFVQNLKTQQQPLSWLMWSVHAPRWHPSGFTAFKPVCSIISILSLLLTALSPTHAPVGYHPRYVICIFDVAYSLRSFWKKNEKNHSAFAACWHCLVSSIMPLSPLPRPPHLAGAVPSHIPPQVPHRQTANNT